LENGNGCENVKELNLIVNPTPVAELQEDYLLCTNNPDLTIRAPKGFDRYRWFKTNGTDPEILSIDPVISITEIGNYTINVGYVYPTPDGDQVCESQISFEVKPSNPATITRIKVEDLAENNTLQVFTQGDGDYEYAIDGINFQESDYFEDLAPGLYEITVRDQNGCGETLDKTAVLGYPKFFTPNGDGINDYWELIGLEENFVSSSAVSIFDRYGKLVVSLNEANPKWNGTWNSGPLPADDYWFRASLADGREFNGHFSLKR